MRQAQPSFYTYPGRCTRCYMRCEVCICELIPVIQNETPLTVLMHHRESHKTTNTARIACLALQKSEIRIRGRKDDPLDLSDIHKPGRQSILLTLNEKSDVLTTDYTSQFKEPLHLIVPDGSWRQASKMGKREPALQNIPWVRLPTGPTSKYFLRHEHHPEGMATLEAIARTFGIIENPTIQSDLETIFDIMVSRTLSTRPQSQQVVE